MRKHHRYCLQAMAKEYRDGNVSASQNTRELVDTAQARRPQRADDWHVQVQSDTVTRARANANSVTPLIGLITLAGRLVSVQMSRQDR